MSNENVEIIRRQIAEVGEEIARTDELLEKRGRLVEEVRAAGLTTARSHSCLA